MADKKKKRSGFTVACVVLVVLVCFIVFLVKKDTIVTNLKETNFFERVFGATPQFVEKHEVPQKPDTTGEQKQTVVTEDSTVKIKVETEKKPQPVQEESKPEKQESKNNSDQTTKPATEKEPQTTSSA